MLMLSTPMGATSGGSRCLLTMRNSVWITTRCCFSTTAPKSIAPTQGGDLDNRLKTLLDALRAPKVLAEVPEHAQPSADESPFLCLLEDDALIDGLSVTTDRLLRPEENPSNFVLVIHVVPRLTRTALGAFTWTL